MTTNIWFPFYYTARIKRDPGFFIKQVTLEELPIVILVFGLYGEGLHLASWISLGFLFMALISVYEIGYADNDRIGERKEANPKLSEAYKALGKFRIVPFAWFWAVVFTVIGIAFLPSGARASAAEQLPLLFSDEYRTFFVEAAVAWLVIILISQVAFAVFNRVSLKWRVFAYVSLHVSKYFGFALFFVSNLIGLMFLAAHLVRTWSLYAVRRSGGDMEFIASQLVRLVFFCLFLLVLTIERGVSEVFGAWQTWALLGFCVLRALPEVYRKLL